MLAVIVPMLPPFIFLFSSYRLTRFARQRRTATGRRGASILKFVQKYNIRHAWRTFRPFFNKVFILQSLADFNIFNFQQLFGAVPAEKHYLPSRGAVAAARRQVVLSGTRSNGFRPKTLLRLSGTGRGDPRIRGGTTRSAPRLTQRYYIFQPEANCVNTRHPAFATSPVTAGTTLPTGAPPYPRRHPPCIKRTPAAAVGTAGVRRAMTLHSFFRERISRDAHDADRGSRGRRLRGADDGRDGLPSPRASLRAHGGTGGTCPSSRQSRGVSR